MVKRGQRNRRGQADAIEQEYNSIAFEMGVRQSTIPTRISRSRIPAAAAVRFGSQLAADLEAAGARLVVTLGSEVWDTFLRIRALDARPPVARFLDLYGDAYGRLGSLVIGKSRVDWLPLIHPGLLKGRPDPDAVVDFTAGRTTEGWKTLHARWIASRR